ncbi:hypothetical protein BC332_15811 [Capsicum chinense]|nr:hypothetical protein BC332_15811 [Capsicum chinense]
MSKSKLVSTPLATYFNISSEFRPKIEEEVEIMSNIPYSSVVGSLMYAMVCTRPDLAYTVINLSLFFDRNKVISKDVVGFVDFDYGGALDRPRSLSEYIFTLCSGSQKASLQSIIALCTTDAESVAAIEDSQSVINLIKNDAYHSKTMHISVKYHYIRDTMTAEEIVVKKVHFGEPDRYAY